MIDKLKEIVLSTDHIFFNDTYRKDVTEKGVSDYVTKADIEISNYLHTRLKEEFPDIGFISEEENNTFSPEKDYFILDPIDGTTNFMYRQPLCGVSLGLYKNGNIQMGVIYLPYTKELFWAEKGNGAYLNDTLIHCNKYEKLSECLGLMEFNPYFRNDKQNALIHAEKIYMNCRDLRTFGCAAASIAYVACGRADAFLGRFLKPWDYAAGKIILEEAGGVLTDLNGEFHPEILNSHVIAVTNALYEPFKNLINE